LHEVEEPDRPFAADEELRLAGAVGGDRVDVDVAAVLDGENDAMAVPHRLTHGGVRLAVPVEGTREDAALATACRHPGVAVAIAATNYSEQRLATAAVALYLLLSIVLTTPYAMWRKRAHVSFAESDEPEPSPRPIVPLKPERELK